ncbi:MAG: hypothetical protein ABI779_09095 [Acidobacteriota bacterium]
MNTNERKMGRRQFLAVSSTFAIAAAVAPKLFGAEILTPLKRLAVGFARFDEDATLIAAAGIPAGDGAFIGRGARITASGASGASVDPRQRRGVELLTHYSYLDGAERREAPFTAWACSRSTGCQGNSVGFNVPVDEVQRLRFSVIVESGADAAPKTSRRRAIGGAPVQSQDMPVTLSLLSEPGAIKLVRGFYVIVPLFENDSEPRWSAFQVRRVDGRLALVDAGGNAAPFEHFVLRIDYATL